MRGADRLLSIASGAFVDGSNFVPDVAPEVTVRAAGEAGFGGIGLWFDAERWSDKTVVNIRRACDEAGVVPLDIEVVWIQEGAPDPNHQRLIEAGGEVGAKNVLIISSHPDRTEAKRRYANLCEQAQSAGMFACLEFLSITEVRSLDDALDIILDVDHPNGKLLVDPLHVARSQGRPEDLAAVPKELFTYAQFCDTTVQAPGDGSFDARWEEAVAGRLLPGEGELPLHGFIDNLSDDLPLSIEIWSRQLRESYPNPVARAQAVLNATTRFFDEHNERSQEAVRS
jgi:sugar phosphate isomerase/epimerase